MFDPRVVYLLLKEYKGHSYEHFPPQNLYYNLFHRLNESKFIANPKVKLKFHMLK